MTQQQQLTTQRETRSARYPISRLPKNPYTAVLHMYMSQMIEEIEPSSYEEARRHKKWQDARGDERLAEERNVGSRSGDDTH